MKNNLIIVSFGLLVLFMGPLARAQETAQPALDTLQAAPVMLPVHYEAVLEYFLTAAEQNPARAYELTSKNYKKGTSPQTFATLLQTAGLTNLASKTWTAQERFGSRGALIKGNFTENTEKTHLLSFFLQPHSRFGIQIEAIMETLEVAELQARMPAGDAFSTLLQRDLSTLAGHIEKRLAKSTYKYLSRTARQRTKLSEIRAAYAAFKERGFNVSLPSTGGQIALADGMPRLNDQAQMVVAGTYQNATHNVTFSLAYDYEWEWKLGVFSFQAQAR